MWTSSCCDNSADFTDGPEGGSIITSDTVPHCGDVTKTTRADCEGAGETWAAASRTEGQGDNQIHLADLGHFKAGDTVRIGGLEDRVVTAVHYDAGGDHLINGYMPGRIAFAEVLERDYAGGSTVDVMARSASPTAARMATLARSAAWRGRQTTGTLSREGTTRC